MLDVRFRRDPYLRERIPDETPFPGSSGAALRTTGVARVTASRPPRPGAVGTATDRCARPWTARIEVALFMTCLVGWVVGRSIVPGSGCEDGTGLRYALDLAAVDVVEHSGEGDASGQERAQRRQVDRDRRSRIVNRLAVEF